MKRIFTLIILLASHLFVSAQYSTPGENGSFSFQDLVTISQGVVTLEATDEFHIHEDLTISPTDTLTILENLTIKIAPDKRIFIDGVLISDPQNQAIFTAIDPENNFRGFRFDESHASVLRNTVVEYGGGLSILHSDILVENCIFRYNDRSNTSAVLNLSTSNPVIQNNTFMENGGSAIGSGANIISVPLILNNQFIRNSSDNTNRPQINMGPTGGDTLKIIGNVIEGHYTMAGGIAVSNLLAVGNSIALIEDNYVFDNRYGYTATGNNIMSIIRHNHFIDNNIQGDPALGGSGLNFLGTVNTNTALVYNNVITGNLWGVTIQNNAQPNLGEDGNPMTGFNVIENNANNGVTYGLFNNTPQPVFAQNNYWGTDDPEIAAQYIVGEHQDEDLGPVTFLPIWVPGNFIEEFIFPADLNDALSDNLTGIIDHDAQTVTFTVEYGTDVTNLTPEISVSPYATVLPEGGQAGDFTHPVNYTVISFHEAERTYEVTVNVMDPPTYTLTFNVTDLDANPITDAMITINGEQHPAGLYVFPELLPGSYDYLVEKQGYFPEEGTAVIEDDDLLVEVALDPETGISGPSLVNGMAVYPNPARDYIELNFNENSNGNILRVFSITGSLVMEIANINPLHRIDISSLESGLYLLQFFNDQKTYTRKLTVRR